MLAQQIADLLTLCLKPTSAERIDPENYAVHLEDGKVVGCRKIEQFNSVFTYISDVAVHPDYRRRGISKALAEKTMANITTPLIVGCIRVGNIAEETFAKDLGFQPTATYESPKGREYRLWVKVR